MFTDCLELALLAKYATKNQTLPVVQKLSTKFDALKFFLKLLWEIKALDNKKYQELSAPLRKIGGGIGEWMKSLKKETPANTGE